MMLPDQSARERALNTSASFIVQAPAGSGKTQLLVQRYLALLATVEVPESIVAITFTKKAAAEMLGRVSEALHSPECRVAPDRIRQWGLLENPARLRVQTIDALCASITGQMPWLARFGAMPSITEKAQDLYREAAQRTLHSYASGGEGARAIGALLLHLDNDFGNAEKLLMNMLERRDQWQRLIGVKPDLNQMRTRMEETLGKRIAETWETVEALFPAGRYEQTLSLMGHSRREELPDFLVTKKGTWRKRIDGFDAKNRRKPEMTQLLAGLESEHALLAALDEAGALPPARFENQQWQALAAIVEVLPLAVAELLETFRERGTVDFAQLGIAASGALGEAHEPTDLALALGHRIEHILVDEFQDTSHAQFKLLKSLTAGWDPGEGRTLFLVGDPMQSIYRFRQAEVGLFRKAQREGIGDIHLEALTLSMNFRSQPLIVNWVNGAFADAPSVAARDEHGEPPTIEAFFGDSFPAEALRVADIVESTHEGTTAILVRARTHLPCIVAELKRRGIPFQAIDIDDLSQRPVIQDLLALTFALLHLADRTSWLAILRAPWCGLTLADLLTLTAGHGGPLWPWLQRPDFELSADGRARLDRVRPVLEDALEMRGRQTLRAWVEETWRGLGGPACVHEETEMQDARAYFDLLAGLEAGGDLEDFDGLRAQVVSLFAQPDAHADGRLQLMTIHKAKGLEFDTVIVPGMGRLAGSDDAQLLLWQEWSEDEVVLAPIPAGGAETDALYRYLQRLEQEKEKHETRRLLYVAATRARNRLYFLGHTGVAKQTVSRPSEGSFLKILWTQAEPVFHSAYAARAAGPALDANAVAERRKLRRVPSGWQIPSPVETLTWRAADGEASGEFEHVSFDWVGDTTRHVGAVIHACLQRIAVERSDTWEKESVRAALSNLGVCPADLETAVAHVDAGLSRSLADPKAQWILAAHPGAECEKPVTGILDGTTYSIVIDRTFVDPAGTRWIIDYKSSAHDGGGLDKFLDAERERYRAKLELYARLMQHWDPRPVKLGLYFPLLGGWREWDAPPMVMRQASLFGD